MSVMRPGPRICVARFALPSTLAFTSPRIVTAIINGSAPADLTVTGLWVTSNHDRARSQP
jgi:hypothetical protein